MQQTEDSNGEGLKTASRFNTIAAFQKRLGHNEGDKWSSCTVSGSTEGRLAAVDSLQSHHGLFERCFPDDDDFAFLQSRVTSPDDLIFVRFREHTFWNLAPSQNSRSWNFIRKLQPWTGLPRLSDKFHRQQTSLSQFASTPPPNWQCTWVLIVIVILVDTNQCMS